MLVYDMKIWDLCLNTLGFNLKNKCCQIQLSKLVGLNYFKLQIQTKLIIYHKL